MGMSTAEIVELAKKKVLEELKDCCIVWNDVEDGAELPPVFERFCNQDGEPVFRDSEGTWKSVITGKQIEVTSWCNLPKRKRS